MTDHAKELRRHARKTGRPSGDIRTHRIGVKWCELYAGGPNLDAAIDAMIQPAKGT